MKTCVIHFGMHKTGSSSIQQSLSNQLNNRKWKYLDLGSANHGAALSTIIPAQPHPRLLALGKLDQTAFEKRKLKQQPKLIKELESDSENLLISAEWLCSRIPLSELTEFRDLIANHVDKIILVGYIRSPKGYMESAFQEKLKHFNLRKLAFNQHYPQYQKKIEKFDQVFGRENVLTWKFEPKSFVNGCVVQDFCSRLGIDFPVNLIKRVNESLSREAIAFLYTYLKHLPSLPKHQKSALSSERLLTDRLTTLSGSKMQFSWSAVTPVMNKHQHDIAWMENRLGESLKEPRIKLINPIRSEKALLTYKPDDLQWLAQQLGADYETRWHPKMPPREVAEWIHALRLKLVQEANIEKA